MDKPVGTALVTFTASGGVPTLDQAAGLLNVPTAALDHDFGVVPIELEANVFAVAVADEHLPDTPGAADARIFSNPSISAFGADDIVGDQEER